MSHTYLQDFIAFANNPAQFSATFEDKTHDFYSEFHTYSKVVQLSRFTKTPTTLIYRGTHFSDSIPKDLKFLGIWLDGKLFRRGFLKDTDCLYRASCRYQNQ